MFESKSFKVCNHNPTLIYPDKSSKINYYAADEDGVAFFTGNLIVNLTKTPGLRSIATTYNIPQLAKHMLPRPDEIVLAWEDFKAPPVRPTFWQALDSYCKSKDYHNICFHCGHGHGRTGTSLAAMKIANLGFDAESAILSIRDDYCQMAIESREQIFYLIHLDIEINGAPDLSDEKFEELVDKLDSHPRLLFNKINALNNE